MPINGEARRHQKRITLAGRTIDTINLVDHLTGEVLLAWPDGWWCGGRVAGYGLVDVVGIRGLRCAVVVDGDRVDDEALTYELMRPIIVREPADCGDPEDAAWVQHLLIVPVERGQISLTCSRAEGSRTVRQYLITLPAIAERTKEIEPQRFYVARFSITAVTVP